MDTQLSNEAFVLKPEDTTRLSNLCGPLNSHLQELERHFGVRISNRGYSFTVVGKECRAATCFLKNLYNKAEQGLTLNDIHTKLQQRNVQEVMENATFNEADNRDDKSVTIQTPCRLIKSRGVNQRSYVCDIDSYDLTFGIGPAGTGKTYLAVAKGVELLEREVIRKMVLVRPAVEAGEQLGFLPGDLIQKVDPYLRPMYDALYEMIKPDKVQRLLELGVIEIAPLAYMRGRSLNDSFIILDEAQNTSKQQMKMFLTRIGSCSKAVITGDLTQADLPHNQLSGLKHAIQILQGIDKIAFCLFDTDDVTRHPLLREIINAYDKDNGAPP